MTMLVSDLILKICDNSVLLWKYKFLAAVTPAGYFCDLNASTITQFDAHVCKFLAPFCHHVPAWTVNARCLV